MHKCLFATLAAASLVSGCSDTLVYGERTGLNIAIRSDPAQGQPLEVNTGFQRRVIGYVPPRDPDGGEAVTMVSAFELDREAGNNVFDDTITIQTAFASGAAAKTVGGSEKSVLAIFDRPGVTASPKPSDQEDTQKILGWVGTDPVNARQYLNFLSQRGGSFAETGNVLLTTQAAASDSRNAALNAQFIALEGI